MSTSAAIHTFDLPRPTYPFIPDVIPTDEPVSVHILDAEEAVLFGTGYAAGVVDLLRQFDQIGSPDIVVVEHAHPDHYDAVPILRHLYDDLTVAIPEADAKALAAAGIDADRTLDDGDIIGHTQAILAPGHTPGNMSFFHEPTKTLFVGDTVVHSQSPNAAPGEWSGPLAPIKPELNHDDARARASIRTLLDIDVESARLTHGPNVDDAKTALETLVTEVDRA